MKISCLLIVSTLLILLVPVAGQAQSPVPQTDVLRINSITAGEQSNPAVAILQDGSYFFVWESNSSPGNDTSGTAIVGRHFRSDGTATGPEFQINQVVSSSQRFPDVAVLDNGTFVVAWTGKNRVRARRFRLAPLPTPVGRETVLNSADVLPHAVSLTPAPGGDFYAIWQDETDPTPPFFVNGFTLRRFDARLQPVGESFFVEGFDRLGPKPQMVVIPKKGDLVVAWRDAFIRVDPEGNPIYSAQDLTTNSIAGISVNRHGNLLIAGDLIEDPGFGLGYRESTRYAQVFGSNGLPRRVAKVIEPTSGFFTGSQTTTTLALPWEEDGFLVAWDSHRGGILGRRIGPRGRLISKFSITDSGFKADGATNGEKAVFTFVQFDNNLDIFARFFVAPTPQ